MLGSAAVCSGGVWQVSCLRFLLHCLTIRVYTPNSRLSICYDVKTILANSECFAYASRWVGLYQQHDCTGRVATLAFFTGLRLGRLVYA